MTALIADYGEDSQSLHLICSYLSYVLCGRSLIFEILKRNFKGPENFNKFLPLRGL